MGSLGGWGWGTGSAFGVGQNSVVLPQNLLDNVGTLLEGFEATGDWVVSIGSIAANTTQIKQGAQSIKLTSAVGSGGRMQKTVSWDMSALSSCVRLNAYVHGAPTNKPITVQFASTADFSKNFSYTYTLPNDERWHEINIMPGDWTNTGGESWANTMIRFRITISAAAGETLQVSVDNLRGGVVQRPALLVAFDDNRESQYDVALPIARAHNVRCSLHVPTATPGSAGHNSWAQLQEFYGAGWTVGNHTQEHVDLTTLSQAEAEAEIAAAAADLTAQGLGRDALYLSCPGGGYNATVRAALDGAGVRLAMIGAGSATKQLALPLGHGCTVRTLSLTDTVTLATAQGWADTAVSRGELLHLTGHDLVAGEPAPTEWNGDDFDDLLAYAIAQGAALITMDDLYRLASGPVTIPEAVA